MTKPTSPVSSASRSLIFGVKLLAEAVGVKIEEIREHCPETELEVFVHGALCMAYSGRCLLSGYINKRDPNQGTCTNACRWEYKVEEGKENDTGDIVEKFPGCKQFGLVNSERNIDLECKQLLDQRSDN